MNQKILFIVLSLSLAACLTGCYKKGKLPVADFSYKESKDLLIRDTVTFYNQSQNSSSYDWTFGDGASSVDISPVHVYQDTGTYTVSLKAYSSGKADWSTKSRIIHFH